jgi:hypothetical protein
MPDEALTAYFSFLSPNNHVLLLPPLLETRICTVFSFLCVNKHLKKKLTVILSYSINNLVLKPIFTQLRHPGDLLNDRIMTQILKTQGQKSILRVAQNMKKRIKLTENIAKQKTIVHKYCTDFTKLHFRG